MLDNKQKPSTTTTVIPPTEKNNKYEYIHEYVVNERPYRPQIETMFGNGVNIPADQLKYEGKGRLCYVI